MNPQLQRKLVKDYNIIHQSTLWSAFDTDIIRLQIWELKDEREPALPDHSYPMYYVVKHIDGLGIVGRQCYNDIDSAFHAIYVAYRNYLNHSIEVPF